MFKTGTGSGWQGDLAKDAQRVTAMLSYDRKSLWKTAAAL
jgi:hypothetical protein